MATNKTATLTFRIAPHFKSALRVAADLEHRSVANMVEVMIRDYCEQRGISISIEKKTKRKDNEGVRR